MRFPLCLLAVLIAVFGAISSEAQRRDTGTPHSLRALRGALEDYATLAKLFYERDQKDRLAGAYRGEAASTTEACAAQRAGVIEIGPIDLTPTGPSNGLTPHITPGIPFTLANFLECPFGRVIYHPAITVTYSGASSSDCQSSERHHWGEPDGDGQLKPLAPGERIRGREPWILPNSPTRTISPPGAPVSPAGPGGPYRSVPGLDGDTGINDGNNCGTALLCFLAELLGREEAERFKREAEEALRKAKGPCHHFAWEVAEDPWAGCQIVFM